MIITVGNTKGGVGKTTVALHLAIEAARDRHRVWLVDGDRQGTALAATVARGDRSPTLASACYPDGATLRRQVEAQAGLYDVTIIDAGGRDSSALRAALLLSDVTLIPFQPRSFDVWGLEDMAGLIKEARAYGEVSAVAMLNAADAQGQDNAEAREAVRTYDLQLLDASLGRRKAFANATSQGLSVTELQGRAYDPKAEDEIAVVYHDIVISSSYHFERT